jgi:CubicO group peptidase (beta-lactamase class C family)
VWPTLKVPTRIYDWPTATARLAAQAPQWDPGTAAGYPSITQGFLVGEVVRRITGRSLGAFFADEVAGPLGADYAASAPGKTAAAAPGTGIRVRDGNSVAWRRAQIPAASGFGNARSVALVQSVRAAYDGLKGLRA